MTLSESTICAWKATHVEGQEVVSLALSLGFDQSVTVNLAPHTLPDIAHSLLTAYGIWQSYREDREDDDPEPPTSGGLGVGCPVIGHGGDGRRGFISAPPFGCNPAAPGMAWVQWTRLGPTAGDDGEQFDFHIHEECLNDLTIDTATLR